MLIFTFPTAGSWTEIISIILLFLLLWSVQGMEDGMRRIEEYAYPREDQRLRQAMGVPSGINKLLIVNKEIQPGRVTMIIVKEELGH